jgi:hypothetical protein
VAGSQLAGVVLLPPHRQLGDVGHHRSLGAATWTAVSGKSLARQHSAVLASVAVFAVENRLTHPVLAV